MNVPDGFYRGKNGRIYPNKRESLLDRTKAAIEARSRNDGMEEYLPTTGTDSDFGTGYEVVDPAPSRGLDKRGARAQKLGYNRELQYLVILMRDDSLIGYEGVTPDEWESLENYVSTTDYIESVLSRYQGGAWNSVYGQPPQSTGQSFEQGTQD
jgi:hypothetical protein